MSKFKVALLGKNQILEDELINALIKEGVEKKNILSMNDDFKEITFDVEDEEARFYLPLESDRLKGFDAIFVFGGLTLSRVEFFEKLKEKISVFVIPYPSSEENLLIKEKNNFTFLLEPETLIIAKIIKTLQPYYLNNFFWSIFESASSKGKEGLKELFDQTRDVLNFKTPKNNVFDRQIAFKLIPYKPELKRETELKIREMSGFKGTLLRNVLMIPCFYGTYINFFADLRIWQQDYPRLINSSFQKEQFWEYSENLLFKDKEIEKPALYINTETKNCINGIVYFDPYKITVKLAIENLAKLE